MHINGYAAFLQPDDIYNGKRNEKGQKDGEGKMVYGSGDIYDGHWQKDTRHGHGRYTWVNGDEYVGIGVLGKKWQRQDSLSKR